MFNVYNVHIEDKVLSVMPTRDQVVTFRVTSADLKLFEKAGNLLWNQAPISRSRLVLELAKIGAQTIIKKGDSGR